MSLIESLGGVFKLIAHGVRLGVFIPTSIMIPTMNGPSILWM